jgi:hypothetical protein
MERIYSLCLLMGGYRLLTRVSTYVTRYAELDYSWIMEAQDRRTSEECTHTQDTYTMPSDMHPDKTDTTQPTNHGPDAAPRWFRHARELPTGRRGASSCSVGNHPAQPWRPGAFFSERRCSDGDGHLPLACHLSSSSAACSLTSQRSSASCTAPGPCRQEHPPAAAT